MYAEVDILVIELQKHYYSGTQIELSLDRKTETFQRENETETKTDFCHSHCLPGNEQQDLMKTHTAEELLENII